MLSRNRHLLRCTLLLCGIAAIFPIAAGANSKGSIAATAATAAISTAGLPGDWPMYGHDPQRTSFNPDETTIGVANVASLIQEWQAPIGIGSYPAFSAPSIANGKVYVGSSRGNGNNFFALDAATGTPAWSAFIGYNSAECFGVGIGSTAAISGTIVAIGGGDGAYYGLNTGDGSQAWRDPISAGATGFAWVSPLLANGRAYVGAASDCDNPSVRGEVRALDLQTGQHLGSAFMVPEGEAGGGIWNSPAISIDGTRLFAVSGEDYDQYDGQYNRAMLEIDPTSMQILAANKQGVPNQDQDWASSVVVFHDATDPTMVGAGHKNGIFYAYDQNNINGGPQWNKFPGPETGSAAAYDPTFGVGGTIFYATQQRLYALDPANGHDRWPSAFTGETHGSIAIANGLIYVNNLGTLKIFSELDGSLLRSITPSAFGLSYSGPAVSHGIVYWTANGYLYAWGLPPAGPTSTPVPPPCPGERFTDVCPPDYFYTQVLALNDDNIISGYSTTPPCDNSLWIPCFKPYNGGTRGQISKVVSLAAGLNDPVSTQHFEDVPPGSTFYTYTERLAERGIVGGYACGGPNEPCGPANLPYFRTNNNVTRGQLSKIIANTFGWAEPVDTQQFEDVLPGSTFFAYIGRLYSRGILTGYLCGGEGEPCGPANLPYFRTNNDVTRGQTAKIVQNARSLPTVTPTATLTAISTDTPTSMPTDTATPAPTGTPLLSPSDIREHPVGGESVRHEHRRAVETAGRAWSQFFIFPF